MKKRLPALALAGALLLALLSACSTTQSQVNTYNATLYVRGVLDETYTGRADDAYMVLMNTDAEAVKKTYEENLEAEYLQRLTVRFQLEDQYLTDRQRQDFMDLLDRVYAKVSYSVKAAVPLDDSRYCVEVSVSPVTFFANAYADGYKDLVKDFSRTHSRPTEEELSKLTAAQADRQLRRYEQDWADAVYEYLYPRLDAVTNGPSVTKLVLVYPTGQGLYTLSATDLRDLDDCLLQY